jgi:hypothetical protein
VNFSQFNFSRPREPCCFKSLIRKTPHLESVSLTGKKFIPYSTNSVIRRLFAFKIFSASENYNRQSRRIKSFILLDRRRRRRRDNSQMFQTHTEIERDRKSRTEPAAAKTNGCSTVNSSGSSRIIFRQSIDFNLSRINYNRRY